MADMDPFTLTTPLSNRDTTTTCTHTQRSTNTIYHPTQYTLTIPELVIYNDPGRQPTLVHSACYTSRIDASNPPRDGPILYRVPVPARRADSHYSSSCLHLQESLAQTRLPAQRPLPLRNHNPVLPIDHTQVLLTHLTARPFPSPWPLPRPPDRASRDRRALLNP